MLKSIKEFFSSYSTEVLKPAFSWMNQHRKGCLVFSAFTGLIYLVICGIWYVAYMGTLQEIYGNIKTKLTKKKETEE